jgi:hypothetical protein
MMEVHKVLKVLEIVSNYLTFKELYHLSHVNKFFYQKFHEITSNEFLTSPGDFCRISSIFHRFYSAQNNDEKKSVVEEIKKYSNLKRVPRKNLLHGIKINFSPFKFICSNELNNFLYIFVESWEQKIKLINMLSFIRDTFVITKNKKIWKKLLKRPVTVVENFYEIVIKHLENFFVFDEEDTKIYTDKINCVNIYLTLNENRFKDIHGTSLYFQTTVTKKIIVTDSTNGINFIKTSEVNLSDMSKFLESSKQGIIVDSLINVSDFLRIVSFFPEDVVYIKIDYKKSWNNLKKCGKIKGMLKDDRILRSK